MNINEIVKLAEQYGFTCEILSRSLYIKSKYDSFYFKISDLNKKQIQLYHLNNTTNKKFSSRYHKHRKYYDVPYMLNSIREHDQFKDPSHKKKAKIELLYEQINNEKLNRSKSKKSKYIS